MPSIKRNGIRRSLPEKWLPGIYIAPCATAIVPAVYTRAVGGGRVRHTAGKGVEDETVRDNASGLTAATEPSDRLLARSVSGGDGGGGLGPIKVVHAADVTVEGENFANKPTGTTVVNDMLFSGGQALKFTADVTASHTDTVNFNCSTVCDVVLMARAGQSGGTPSFSVNGSTPQAITTSNQVAPEPYTFMNLPAGSNEIRVTASGTGTGHNAFLDVAKFPADGGGGGTPPDGGGGGGLTYIGSATGKTETTSQDKVTDKVAVTVPPGTE